MRQEWHKAVRWVQGGDVHVLLTRMSARALVEGGHKAACKAAQARVSAMTTGQTANGRAKARVNGTSPCIICLDADPEPIQSGCACRGDAGLAHVMGRVEAAVHRQKSTGSCEGWARCVTCEQIFNGAMLVGLVET